jgi:hypothetical protein
MGKLPRNIWKDTVDVFVVANIPRQPTTAAHTAVWPFSDFLRKPAFSHSLNPLPRGDVAPVETVDDFVL